MNQIKTQPEEMEQQMNQEQLLLKVMLEDRITILQDLRGQEQSHLVLLLEIHPILLLCLLEIILNLPIKKVVAQVPMANHLKAPQLLKLMMTMRMILHL
jgi:hypothetical protein